MMMMMMVVITQEFQLMLISRPWWCILATMCRYRRHSQCLPLGSRLHARTLWPAWTTRRRRHQFTWRHRRRRWWWSQWRALSCCSSRAALRQARQPRPLKSHHRPLRRRYQPHCHRPVPPAQNTSRCSDLTTACWPRRRAVDRSLGHCHRQLKHPAAVVQMGYWARTRSDLQCSIVRWSQSLSE